MPFDDLRSFIAEVKRGGGCKVIRRANWETDIGVLTELGAEQPNPPLLLFEDIEGFPAGYRVASNLFSSPTRTALAFGFPQEARGVELVRAMKDKIVRGIKPIPPVVVTDAPVKQNVRLNADVNLFDFPTPRWHEGDGGRYIGTGCCVFMRDPDDGWVNMATYRVQVHDRSTATIVIVPGHHGDMIRRKYWQRGKACPIAVSCGQEPLLFSAASWERMPWGTSELDFAGGMAGRPVPVTQGVTTDLPIPATAEIVLEGEMVPPEVEARTEGPFGEWAGYYASGEAQQPAFRVKSILHRDDPIIQGNPPSRFPGVWTLGRHYQKAAVLWAELEKNMPGVTGVRMLEDSAVHTIAIISLKQQYAGHAKQAALIAAGLSATGLCLRFAIVVDDDIDPFDTSRVLWALGTRCDPEDAIDIIRRCWSGRTVPLRSPEKKQVGNVEQSMAIILACKPFYWIKDFPASVESSPQQREKVLLRFPDVFAPGIDEVRASDGAGRSRGNKKGEPKK